MTDAPSSARKQYTTSHLAVIYPDTYPIPEKVHTNMIFGINQIPKFLTLKLAGYFARHLQAGGLVDPPPPSKNFETANN